MRTFDIGGELPVNRLGFGAGRITGHGYWGQPANADAAMHVVRQAVADGVTLIDTADNYGPAISEELIARALHPYASNVVIATKGGVVRTGPDRWHHAGRPEQLRAACEASLRRLRLETIAVYQLHRFDPEVPHADQLETLAELRAEGKICHIGLDTVSSAELLAALEIAPIASVQNRFGLDYRADEDVLRLCESRSIAYLPYLPLGGGNPPIHATGTVVDIASTHDATSRQIALAWLLARSPVTLPTPGTGDPAHLAENLAAARIRLSEAEIQRLNVLRPETE